FCARQLGEGYLYLGTPSGLIRFDGMRFSRVDAVGDAWVQDLAGDADGDLWLATDGRGGVHVQRGVVTFLGRGSGRPSLTVRQLLLERSGMLIVCTLGGIVRYAGGKFIPLGGGELLTDRDVLAACATKDGNVWISGKGPSVIVWDGKIATRREIGSVPPVAT